MARQEAHFITVIMVGTVSTLLFGIINLERLQVSMESEDFSPVSLESSFHPAIIPYIDSEKDCRKRSESFWNGEECMDAEHSPFW